MSTIGVTLFSDPMCPWAYSAEPALRVLEWRYGSALEWRRVLIGLTERAEQYVARGYTTLGAAQGQLSFRRFGMPFSPAPRRRVSATARACRACVAARLIDPAAESRVFRALQLAAFTTQLVLDEDADVLAALEGVPGVDARRVVGLLDDPAVGEAYERDRAEARTAAGSPSERQGKTAQTDGPVRYTAPSLIFERDGRRLEAGGFQPVEAYDVLVANLDPAIARREPPDDVGPLLEAFPDGLTTQEVALLLTHGNDAPDRTAAERLLLAAVDAGAAARRAVGDDAVWTLPEAGAAR